jgi:anti-anti-sigma factor
MQFKVTSSRIDHGAMLISVEGELDLATTEHVRRPAQLAISAERPVLLDLSKCPFIDSSGLRLVVQIREGLTDGEGASAPLAVVASSEIRELFSMTAIDLSIPVFLTREQALESLGAIRSHINASQGEGEQESPSHPPATTAGGHQTYPSAG